MQKTPAPQSAIKSGSAHRPHATHRQTPAPHHTVADGQRTPGVSAYDNARSAHPAHLNLLHLQRTVGNQAVGQLIQAKFTISRPHDPDEREADQVAETVMRMTEPGAPAAEDTAMQPKPLVQRITPFVQREAEEEEEAIAAQPALQRALGDGAEDEAEDIVATKPLIQRLSKSALEKGEEEEAVEADTAVQRMPEYQLKEREENVGTTGPLIQRQAMEEEEAVQTKELSGQLPQQVVNTFPTLTSSPGSRLQRVCSECEEKVRRLPEEEGVIQNKPLMYQHFGAKAPLIQPKEGHAQTPQVSPAVAANIHALEGGGSPLPQGTRAFFEPRFGADFSQVRVHTDSRATETAHSINARAFTVGRNIAFGTGRYAPHLHEGRQLLAHELTHVVQQKGSQLQRAQPRATGQAPQVATSVAPEAEPMIQRQPDNHGGSGPTDTSGGGGGGQGGNVAPMSPKFSVVQGPVQMGQPEKLSEVLGLPPGTIPPGAAANPEFLLSLAAGSPNGSASHLEEVIGVPDEVAGAMPEGQVVEMSESQLMGIPEDPSIADKAAAGGARSTAAQMTRDLVRYGYASAGPNAIGIVGFPQSKLVRAVTDFKLGQGPILPESRILLGHTAVYVRIDGQITLIRSYAPESLIDAAIHFKDVRAGTGGVPATIVDHLGQRMPPGGRMFDIASGRSIEYAVPKDLAAKFASSLPEGGPLPGELYTAQPEVAAMMKEARMCHGRNCVHWAITEVERALGGTVGPGGKSVNDLSGIDSARQGKMQGYLTKGGKDAVKLPGGQVSEPVRGKMPGSVKALRWGGRIFLVGGIALSAYRIANAPEGHLGEVVGEEVGGHAGGLGGAALGAAGCVAFGIATGGVGLLLCGLGGGFLGAIGGTKVGGAIGTAVDTIASLPELMAQLFGVTGDLLKAAGNIASMPGQVLGMGLVAGREQLNPMNWDTRYMPPQVRADLFAIGNAIWARIEKLDLNGYLEHVSQPISALGVPADAAGRLAAGMVAIAQSQGQANAALTGDDILKMPALEFNRYMREWRLAFIQDPEYIAGFGGMFEDERYLTLHLMPLLQTRAMVNPKNWDLSAIPAMDFDDGSDVDNQGLIEQVGEAAWAKLESLRQDELPKVLPKTLPFFGIGEPVFAELAKGVGPLMAGKSGVPLPGELDADADLFREQTPESFVRFLQEYKTGFKFKHEPHEVAATALSWVRSGFQPW